MMRLLQQREMLKTETQRYTLLAEILILLERPMSSWEERLNSCNRTSINHRMLRRDNSKGFINSRMISDSKTRKLTSNTLELLFLKRRPRTWMREPSTWLRLLTRKLLLLRELWLSKMDSRETSTFLSKISSQLMLISTMSKDQMIEPLNSKSNFSDKRIKKSLNHKTKLIIWENSKPETRKLRFKLNI